ncbi:acyl carrier protein [Kineothrix alysoides]|uniref:Acyl carrier protein n=1 Tax=Kineothrix alysoides TaxID=1469948 RepID=A0A4R1QQT3_9FIRM|nr:acyl carrier protein [Kineothrix alysoides]TCL56199.1 acyl carrier protein [Kineothrix alysoides]
MKMNKYNIYEIISSVLGVDFEFVKSMDENEDLVSMGMDSIKFISIVVALEEAFEVEYPDECLVITHSNTLNKLASNVSEALEKKTEERQNE